MFTKSAFKDAINPPEFMKKRLREMLSLMRFFFEGLVKYKLIAYQKKKEQRYFEMNSLIETLNSIKGKVSVIGNKEKSFVPYSQLMHRVKYNYRSGGLLIKSILENKIIPRGCSTPFKINSLLFDIEEVNYYYNTLIKDDMLYNYTLLYIIFDLDLFAFPN
ncbi:hypothetical protein [Paenibacillus sp. GbtcB18]|uniref:hypothetical protein n=1 Tax=Paenibacillus sp. GbtcB18 TaxID=2824763 RepID=UPI001C305963|nr:hypothetical protein [Paenibacillus sp. GbtcB18]